jgi:Tfp pilus assembly protein PilZ
VTRRTAERHQRRIEVRFWRRGNPQAHSGFTIDVSRSGLFLGTSVPLDPGERLRLELLDRERGFLIEGEVARVHRVSLALRHVEQPGVGVRFLQPAELVAQLVAGAKVRTGSVPAPALRFGAASPRPAAPTSPAQAPAAAAPSQPAPAPPSPPAAPEPPERADQAEIDELFGAAARAPAAPPAPAPSPAAPVSPPISRAVAVEFVDRASFLSVYHRDIVAGGLFVTTESPAALHATVTIELRPPIQTPSPLLFEARVVHRFDPAGGTGGKAGLAGMGVQFLDPDRVRSALAAVVTELRR